MGKGRLIREKRAQQQHSTPLMWVVLFAVVSPVMAGTGIWAVANRAANNEHALHWIDIGINEVRDIPITNEEPITATGVGPGIIHLKNLVKPHEIRKIMQKTQTRLKPVSLTSTNVGAWRSSKMLTTSSGNGPSTLNKRIKEITQLSDTLINNATIQVQQYDVHDRYLPHYDSKLLSGLGVPTPRDAYPYVGRFLTIVVYLTDADGGETIFPFSHMSADEAWEYASHSSPSEKISKTSKIVSYWENYCECVRKNPSSGVSVKPVAGDAVLFYSHYDNEDGKLGEINPNSFHGGCVVAPNSEKYMMNYWVNIHPTMFADLPDDKRRQPVTEKYEPSPSEWGVLRNLCKKEK
eukprot:TRINITY_DN216_c3_g1_i1.p1 TRINITY_DN216_c3_g1~~TRINITY_DN216_c3_g1_i1.p1  ORF type:complete len:368 (+),score=63.75 TRINITY_DN216_c3_g1_i1:57-1106(+)